MERIPNLCERPNGSGKEAAPATTHNGSLVPQAEKTSVVVHGSIDLTPEALQSVMRSIMTDVQPLFAAFGDKSAEGEATLKETSAFCFNPHTGEIRIEHVKEARIVKEQRTEL
jgi:hypothetical protein